MKSAQILRLQYQIYGLYLGEYVLSSILFKGFNGLGFKKSVLQEALASNPRGCYTINKFHLAAVQFQ